MKKPYQRPLTLCVAVATELFIAASATDTLDIYYDGDVISDERDIL